MSEAALGSYLASTSESLDPVSNKLSLYTSNLFCQILFEGNITLCIMFSGNIISSEGSAKGYCAESLGGGHYGHWAHNLNTGHQGCG